MRANEDTHRNLSLPKNLMGVLVQRYNAKEDPRGVQRYVDRMGLTWPIIVGDDIPGERLPYLLLNRDGTVYAFHDRKKRSLASLLDEMLAGEE